MIGATGTVAEIHGKGHYRMDTTVIDNSSDIDWLIDVHNVPDDTMFAILYGNEDAPSKIECWFNLVPEYNQKPDFIWTSDV